MPSMESVSVWKRMFVGFHTFRAEVVPIGNQITYNGWLVVQSSNLQYDIRYLDVNLCRLITFCSILLLIAPSGLCTYECWFLYAYLIRSLHDKKALTLIAGVPINTRHRLTPDNQ